MLPYLFALALGCFVLERLVPGWQLPQVRTWPVRVIAVNCVQLTVVLLAGITWERWLSSWSVLHLRQHLPPLAGGCFAYFIATFVFTGGIAGDIASTFSGARSTRFTIAL